MPRPAWFLRGLPSVGTASGMGRLLTGAASWRGAGRADSVSRGLTTTAAAFALTGSAGRGRDAVAVARLLPDDAFAFAARAFVEVRLRSAAFDPEVNLFREAFATSTTRS